MLLLRHGESEFNVVYSATRQDPGIEDPPLTEIGRQQAAVAARGLAGRDLRRVISSPYTRAIETAVIVAEALGLPIEIEPIVRERRAFTCDVGAKRTRLMEAWPGLVFDHLDEHWWSEDEESDRDLLGRCDAFRQHMAGRDDWPHLAVVSHWGFIRGLTGQALANATTIAFDPT